MNCLNIPEDCSQQWEVILLLLSSEEKKIDRTSDSEIEVMNYFYKNEGVRKILLQWLRQMYSTYARKKTDMDTATKSDDISLVWRHKGNESFRTNAIEESYKCYTKSVIYAEPGGPMYPLAFANRSASLLRLKKYKECLTDIALALENKYPDEQKHKLYLRRADCLIELHQATNAREALEQARKHAEGLALPAVHSTEFERHLKVLEKKLDLLDNVNEPCEEVDLPIHLSSENPQFVSASNALELRRSETAGRYVLAKEATQRGDILFAEDPYAFVALPLQDDMAVVCENCCRTDFNPVPNTLFCTLPVPWYRTQRCPLAPDSLQDDFPTHCNLCSRSIYCGEECRAAAWLSVHRWECSGAQSRLFPTIGIAHLALRVLLVSANNGFPPLPGDINGKSIEAADVFKCYTDCDNIDIYNKETPPFYRMFNLVTNFNKMNNADFIQYALTATMLTIYLETFTTFFPYFTTRLPYSLAKGQSRLLAASIILRSLGQLICNGHAALSLAVVDDDQDEKDDSVTLTEREVRHATAIYPSAAMMNHSCDPNIINTFYRNRLIIRCGRELSPGSEVLNCYGPHRSREAAVDRRALLRAQYMFNCVCDACSDHERKDAILVFNAYACPWCKGPVIVSGRPQCQQCRRKDISLQAATQQLIKADDMMSQAENATSHVERCDKLQTSYKLKQRVLYRHHTQLRQAADLLARFHAEMGEYSKSVELIKQNIQSLEYQFGSFSVEVAHELRKLADVMLERMFHSPQHTDYRDWCLESHKIIKKAYQLLELNYGSWEPLVRRLKRQEAAVASLLADSKTPESANCVHHNLHYNLKI